MFNGKLKRVEDIIVGDMLMGIDSKPRTVQATHGGIGQMYLIKQNKGLNYVVNSKHLLTLKKSAAAKKPYGTTKKGRYRWPNGKYGGSPDTVNISVKEYLKKSTDWKRNFLSYREGVEFTEKPIEIEPYFLGVWLGDGGSRDTVITTEDKEIVGYITKYADGLGLKVRENPKQGTKASNYDITGDGSGNILLIRLTGYNLLNNKRRKNRDGFKHIPKEFLYNTRKIRLEVLAGLIDTDGSLRGNCYEIIQKSKRLTEDIRYLVHSLGMRCSCKAKYVKGYDQPYYRMNISGNTHEIPARLKRKQITDYNKKCNPKRTGIKVEYYGIGEYYGFTLDSDGLFFLEDFTVLHNSWSIAQHLLVNKLMTEKNIRILVTCKTLPHLKKSCWLLFNDLISKYELKGFRYNKSDLIISFGGNQMYFTSIDDPEKLKSFEKINYIWAEEATELNKDDFMQLNLRCRGNNPNGINQLFFSFNPIDELSFLKGITDNPPKNTAVCHSTYKDNSFLEPEYVEYLESLIEQDETYHKIYALGVWATPEEIIFTKWEITKQYPKYDKFEIVGYGLDFGFNNPTALSQLGIIDQVPYERELLYESHLTTSDLIDRMKALIPQKQRSDIIVADCSEPARILEIRNAGFNCIGCKKGKDSIKRGIDLIRRYKPQLDSESAFLIKEIKGYKWRKDKDGNILDEPVKIHDHLMDCRRYIYQEMMDKVKVGFVSLADDNKFIRNVEEEAFELSEAAWQDF